MKQLQDILYKVPLLHVKGQTDIEIDQIIMDSREVESNDVFVAIKGGQVNGHDFINSVIKKGVKVIVFDDENLPMNDDTVNWILVKDSREALGIMAANYYDNPSKKLNLIGITGTNGKTSCATLLYNTFKDLGYQCGLLSTIENIIAEKKIIATHTTPNALVINKLLAEMAKRNCTFCFMEVSSHALDQNRTKGLEFKVAAFTNLTRDHLDYHNDFQEYAYAKKKLFDGLSKEAFALYNKDDKNGKIMVQNTKAKKFDYSLQSLADFQGKIISSTLEGLELKINEYYSWFLLPGIFNAYNLLLVFAITQILEEDPLQVLEVLSARPGVPGRFEMVANDKKIAAIVDYAHTPDALKNALKTIKKIRSGNEQVITVVGCGGDRDKGKRPLMTEAALKYSDKVILTSDNPRNEEPSAILEDMMKGVSPVNYKKTLKIIDRKEAIKTAVMLAQPQDIILVAGKGHETYQEIKGKRTDFDDRAILKEALL